MVFIGLSGWSRDSNGHKLAGFCQHKLISMNIKYTCFKNTWSISSLISCLNSYLLGSWVPKSITSSFVKRFLNLSFKESLDKMHLQWYCKGCCHIYKIATFFFFWLPHLTSPQKLPKWCFGVKCKWNWSPRLLFERSPPTPPPTNTHAFPASAGRQTQLCHSPFSPLAMPPSQVARSVDRFAVSESPPSPSRLKAHSKKSICLLVKNRNTCRLVLDKEPTANKYLVTKDQMRTSSTWWRSKWVMKGAN